MFRWMSVYENTAMRLGKKFSFMNTYCFVHSFARRPVLTYSAVADSGIYPPFTIPLEETIRP